MFEFSGKNAVITGAGAGIGRATAFALARKGVQLHISDIDEERIELTAKEVREIGAKVYSYVVDVANREEVKDFSVKVISQVEQVDILHNNAGIALACSMEETSLEDWEKVFNINFWSIIHHLHFFLPKMILGNGDRFVVNTASAGGLFSMPSLAAYCAAKSAVVSLSETMNIELFKYGIHTIALCPGIIDTNIIADMKVELFNKDGQNRKEDIADYYRVNGVSPEKVAKDIIKAINRKKFIQLSPFKQVFPGWILKRLSNRLYQSIIRKAQTPWRDIKETTWIDADERGPGKNYPI